MESLRRAMPFDCAVCCGDEDYAPYVTPCHHEFHLPCLQRWWFLRADPTCPLCRAPIGDMRTGCVIRRVKRFALVGPARFAMMRAVCASIRGDFIPMRLVRRLQVYADTLPEPMRLDVMEILDDVRP